MAAGPASSAPEAESSSPDEELADAVGTTVRLVSTDEGPSSRDVFTRLARGRGAMAVQHRRYALLSRTGRVAELELCGRHWLALMTSPDGTWTLTKPRPRRRELLIHDSDGRQVGSYSARRWVPGGKISLAGTAEALLTASPTHGWHLRASDTAEPIADIGPPRRVTSRGPARTERTISVRTGPSDAPPPAFVVVLIACAVVLLERTLPSGPAISDRV